jgi:peptide/nickel transport system permease protein
VLRALVRRLLTAGLTLVLVTVVVFLLIHMAPGDPLGGDAGDEGRPLTLEAREALRAHYRLDQPVHRQYLFWIGDLVRGDLGRSFHDRRPVAEKIGERLGITLTLNALALLVMVLLSVPIGTLAALKRDTAWDRLPALGTYLLYAIPVFWAGLLAQILLSVRLGWFPLAGLRSSGHDLMGPWQAMLDTARHLVLPVACLSYAGLAYLSRFVRATLIDNAVGESWRAARARGLAPLQVLWRHGFRQAGVPMLTLAGFLLPALVGGSVIVESVFAIPGLGRLFVEAAFQRDVPMLMGLTLLSGAATLAGILAADLTYVFVDPRIRRG